MGGGEAHGLGFKNNEMVTEMIMMMMMIAVKAPQISLIIIKYL